MTYVLALTWSSRELPLDTLRARLDRAPTPIYRYVRAAQLEESRKEYDALSELVRLADMTPIEALRAATIGAARFLHVADSLGTIAPGKVADLVLL
jgi:predicted amidohydrolase YtcJ